MKVFLFHIKKGTFVNVELLNLREKSFYNFLSNLQSVRIPSSGYPSMNVDQGDVINIPFSGTLAFAKGQDFMLSNSNKTFAIEKDVRLLGRM